MPKTYQIKKPPGGTLTCGDNQMGVVDVINGEVHARCTTIPASVRSTRSPQQLSSWVAKELTGVREMDRSTLLSGKIVHKNPQYLPRFQEMGLTSEDKVETYFFFPDKLRHSL